jgi:hypothetical protein
MVRILCIAFVAVAISLAQTSATPAACNSRGGCPCCQGGNCSATATVATAVKVREVAPVVSRTAPKPCAPATSGPATKAVFRHPLRSIVRRLFYRGKR